jgi:hypothetical protein
MIAASEDAISTLVRRMGAEMAASSRAQGELAIEHLLKVLAENEAEFSGTAGGAIEVRALTALQERQGLLLHKHSLERYGAEAIEGVQRELSIGLGKNMRLQDIADRVAGVEGVVERGAARAELITRMELNSSFNQVHERSIVSAAEVLDKPDDPDPMWKRIDEFQDARNHPFSRAADGILAAPGEVFRVPLADVQRFASQMGKRVSGITWPLVGAFYEGIQHPAHFWDRGRQVAFRKSWEDRRKRVVAAARFEAEQNGITVPTIIQS